jgi:hypothetical protein
MYGVGPRQVGANAVTAVVVDQVSNEYIAE